MKTLLRYPGSKWNLAQWIVSMFPVGYKSMTYLEPYFGSGAVLFTKARSKIETVNDLDSRIVNFFKTVRDHPDELAHMIQYTPWARDEYLNSYEVSENSIEDARKFLIRLWQGIGAKTSDKTGWSNNIKPTDSGKGRWSVIHNQIKPVAERLRSANSCVVQIENQNALDVIQRHNYSYVFMYLDPPYMMSTRSRRLYSHEMCYEDHIKLLQIISTTEAKVMISGYDNELYNQYLCHWQKETIEATTEFGKKAKECVWMNYEVNRQIHLEEVNNE